MGGSEKNEINAILNSVEIEVEFEIEVEVGVELGNKLTFLEFSHANMPFSMVITSAGIFLALL